jgi:hypothetical protein
METIIKQSADGIVLIGNNKLDTTQGKVFINNHEITDIDTFFKVAEENKQLQEQLLVSQTNEETFRLEMEDITRALGLTEDTIFDDVKSYARSLKDNWNKLKEWVNKYYDYYTNEKDYIGGRLCFIDMKNKMQEIEQGSDSNISRESRE